MAVERREATAAKLEARVVVAREAVRVEAAPLAEAWVEAARAAAVEPEVVREVAVRAVGPEAAMVAQMAADYREARPACHNFRNTVAPPAEGRVGTTGEAAAHGRRCSQGPRRCCRTTRGQPSSLRARRQV
jgi:hypothetical protein